MNESPMASSYTAPSPSNPPAAATDNPALARVVALDAGQAWLEPLQTGSCGACASAAICGKKGIGSLASRLEARRFAVPGLAQLRVGDTVEIAFAGNRVLAGAAIAYAIPLASGLAAAILAQRQGAGDALTLLTMLVGLAIGFGLSRQAARRLEARGELQASIVRRLAPAPLHFDDSGIARNA